MKTLLLIAGRSQRFWPLTEKTLFPICSTNLLEITNNRLKKAGCNDIILIGGAHNLDNIHKKYPEFSTVEQKDLGLGMRGALLDALPLCGNESVMIVCVNDVIDAVGYQNLMKSMSGSDIAGAILAQKVERYFPGGYLKLDGNRVIEVIEKPGEGNEPSDLVNVVAHIHKNASILLETLKTITNDKDDGYEQALTKLFQNYIYKAVVYEGSWNAIKYPWHMLFLLKTLLKDITEPQIHPSAVIHSSAVLDGPIIISEGVKIMPHATIRGPCHIGHNSIIANNTLVRNASIGSNCVIGYSSEIKSSVLANHVWTHTTYIGDSVIGSNVSFGAGSITGNLRLDEEEISSYIKGEKIKTGLNKFGAVIGNDCRFGIHTGINPGIKIGSGSFVNSHVLVTEDIPNKSFVQTKNGKLTVTSNKKGTPNPNTRNELKNNII